MIRQRLFDISFNFCVIHYLFGLADDVILCAKKSRKCTRLTTVNFKDSLQRSSGVQMQNMNPVIDLTIQKCTMSRNQNPEVITSSAARPGKENFMSTSPDPWGP